MVAHRAEILVTPYLLDPSETGRSAVIEFRASMKRISIAVSVALLVGLLSWVCSLDSTQKDERNENYMEYEGERFRTSKEYSDWDDFKEDPKNYLDSETSRMADAVRRIRFADSASERETVMNQMFDKRFPGFGCSQLGILDREHLELCAAFSIEIPRTGESRYAGYVHVKGRFILVSDFVAPETPIIARVSVSDGHLNFHAVDKSIVRRDPIPVTE